MIRARFDGGDDAATNEALGRRLGLHERQLRRLRSGEKRLAVGDLLLLPDWLTAGIVEFVEAARGRDPVAKARRALEEAVRVGLSGAERAELGAVLFAVKEKSK